MHCFAESSSVALHRGYTTKSNAWVVPLNGHQYRAATGGLSWNESRSLCQQLGGNLAQYGIQDVGTRT